MLKTQHLSHAFTKLKSHQLFAFNVPSTRNNDLRQNPIVLQKRQVRVLASNESRHLMKMYRQLKGRRTGRVKEVFSFETTKFK